MNSGFVGDQQQWHNKLPPSLQRAAPEIYQSTRSEGVTSVRSWVTDQFPFGARDSPTFQDLFTTATNIDFELAGAESETVLMQRLPSSDSPEIGFRKLGALIYKRRTGDNIGAARLLAVRAPGTAIDIMPRWATEDATAFSKAEHQIHERVSKEKGGGGSKGGPKGGSPKKPKGQGKGQRSG